MNDENLLKVHREDSLLYGSTILTFKKLFCNFCSKSWVFIIYPDSTAQYKRTVTDGSVLILNSAKHPILNVRFTDMIPTSLSDLNFDTTLQEVQYMTATVTFRFTRFYYDPVI